MRAGLRLGFAVFGAGLALGPRPALAQDATQPATTNTPATDAVGPRELQNFNLQGTVTRPADQPPAQRTTAPPPAARTTERTTAAPTPRQAAPTERTVQRDKARPTPIETPSERSADRSVEPLRQTRPASSVTVALPSIGNDSGRSSATASAPSLSLDADPVTLASEHKVPILPWLLAALAFVGGIGCLWWRNRSRAAFADGPQLDSYVAPEAAPAPTPEPASGPAPAPPRVPTPPIPGIVSTRLRPWVEIGFHPLRCIVEDERVTIQFELELFNSGSTPARAVLIEASMFNAGPNQDREIGEFFGNPVGEGERIVVIPPLKKMNLRTQVAAERSRVQVYEVGGRQVFVPLIAFNALYRWSNGDGQTSVSYLLGRDTKGEKMAPFRLDLGPRVFRGVGAHPLPAGVRN